MKEILCKQYDDLWWDARRGLPTASNFDRIVTPKTWKPSAAADDYINELVGDIIQLDPAVLTDRGITPAMRNGIDCEPAARAWYAVQRDVIVREVGFCISDCGRYGASPDGLIDESPDGPGVLELKVPLAKTHIGYLRDPELPAVYKVQCHGQLLVTGRPWLDFMSYCPGFPPRIVGVHRDKFTEQLAAYLDDFCRRKDEVLNWLRATS